MTTLPARFWAKVDKSDPNGCWTWTAARLNGYGRFALIGASRLAHRIAFEDARGPIPDGLTLDHLCRNRACVNPDHLEPTTARVNVLRGETVTAENAAKTHCKRGHPFDGANTYRQRCGGRMCRSCERQRKAAVRQARRAVEAVAA